MTSDKLYFPSPFGPVPTSGKLKGIGWEDTTIFQFQKIYPYPTGTPMLDVAFTDTNTTDKDVLFRSCISPPLVPAKTITGAQLLRAQFICFEDNGANDMFLALYIRVIDVRGDTRKDMLAGVTRDNVEIDSGAYMNRRWTATSEAGDYTTQEGDRLWIMLGTGGDPTAGGSHTTHIILGDDNASDLPEDDTDTTSPYLNPWVGFDDVIEYALEGNGDFLGII